MSTFFCCITNKSYTSLKWKGFPRIKNLLITVSNIERSFRYGRSGAVRMCKKIRHVVGHQRSPKSGRSPWPSPSGGGVAATHLLAASGAAWARPLSTAAFASHERATPTPDWPERVVWHGATSRTNKILRWRRSTISCFASWVRELANFCVCATLVDYLLEIGKVQLFTHLLSTLDPFAIIIRTGKSCQKTWRFRY